VGNPFVPDSHVLEDERLAAAPVLGDPVNADDESVSAGLDELLGASPVVAGPTANILYLTLEDRPGLLGPLSAGRFSPPEEAALDPAPDRVASKQRGQRVGIALVQRFVRPPNQLEVSGRHRLQYSTPRS
jgi:hypothetical protein